MERADVPRGSGITTPRQAIADLCPGLFNKTLIIYVKYKAISDQVCSGEKKSGKNKERRRERRDFFALVSFGILRNLSSVNSKHALATFSPRIKMSN